MEPGTFVLHLTQPSVTPSRLVKKRKQDIGGYFSVELPAAAKKVDTTDKTPLAGETQLPVSQILNVEASAPT